MTALLRSGVGGSLLIWVAMCLVDPVAMGAVGTFDLPWLHGETIAGERLVWVGGQALVLFAIWQVAGRRLAPETSGIAAGALLCMAALPMLSRHWFWGIGLFEQIVVQGILLLWLLAQRHIADRLAAGALFVASLIGLALMADAQMRMAGMEIMPGDPALAFSVAYGEWSAPVLPFIGILMLAAVAAYARRDPTWTPTTPVG